MKEIQNLLCVFSDYERQQHQRPYFLKDNALHLRSGPKLLSEFDKIIQFDKVYQTVSQMLEKVTEMVDSTYTASTVVLVGGDENHKLQLIRLIVERGLNKGYDVLFVDRAGKFTEYGTADDDDDLRQAQQLVRIRSAELAAVRYVKTLKKVGKGKQVVSVFLKGKAEKKIHIVELRLQTEEKLMLVQGQLREILRDGVIKERQFQPLSSQFNESQCIVFCGLLSFEKQRTREDTMSIQLLTLLANRNELINTKNMTKKVINNDSEDLLALKQELDRLQKSRVKISKRVQLLQKIYNDMTDTLGQGVNTLNKHSIKLAHLNEYKTTLNQQKLVLEQKTQKLQTEVEEAKAKLQYRPTETAENIYKKMTAKLINRLQNRNHQQTQQKALSTMHTTKSHREHEQKDNQLDGKLWELQCSHNAQLQAMRRKHNQQLKKLPELKELQALLVRAHKYSSLQAYADHVQQMISL